MKLPKQLDSSVSMMQQFYALASHSEQTNGIKPEYVRFTNNLYARYPGVRAEIEALLNDATRIVGNTARSNRRVIHVTTGWHTSASDARIHLTTYIPSTRQTCHVYEDGTHNC